MLTFTRGDWDPESELMGTLTLSVSGTPGNTVRLIVAGVERGQQILDANGTATFSFSTALKVVLHAPATIQYVEGEALGPETTVFLWGPPPAA